MTGLALLRQADRVASAGRTLILASCAALAPSVRPAAAAPADRPLAVITRFGDGPVGPRPSYVNWRWDAAQKAAAADCSRWEVVPHPEGAGQVLRLEVTPAFPWIQAAERVLDLTRAYFPPEADAIVLRVKVVSGTVRLAIGGPTAYFGDSDVITAPQRIEAGAWQDVRFDLHVGLCRNFRRAGYGRVAGAVTYNRWAQEPPGLYVLPGFSGVLLLESATLVASGRGQPFPVFAAADLTPLHQVSTALTNGITLLMADSQVADFERSWRQPGEGIYPPPRLADTAGPSGVDGGALAATARWTEEIRWAGIRSAPAPGAQALALRVRANPCGTSTQLTSRLGQPVDIALLCSRPGAAFPWTRLGPQADWVAATNPPGYTAHLSSRSLLAMDDLHVAAFAARRFVCAGEWETLVVPLEDFVCIAATGDLRPQLVSRASPAADSVAAVAWLLPWPRGYRASDGVIEVADVRWVTVAAPLRRSYPAPIPCTFEPIPELPAYGGWVQSVITPPGEVRP